MNVYSILSIAQKTNTIENQLLALKKADPKQDRYNNMVENQKGLMII